MGRELVQCPSIKAYERLDSTGSKPDILDARESRICLLVRQGSTSARSTVHNQTNREWFHTGWYDFTPLVAIALVWPVELWWRAINGKGNEWTMSVCVLVAGLFLWLALRQSYSRAMRLSAFAAARVRNGVCPCCEGVLPATTCRADKLLLCPTCGCAWQPPASATITPESTS